jgi:hypothetical protein
VLGKPLGDDNGARLGEPVGFGLTGEKSTAVSAGRVTCELLVYLLSSMNIFNRLNHDNPFGRSR